jgi:hypothetical protein
MKHHAGNRSCPWVNFWEQFAVDDSHSVKTLTGVAHASTIDDVYEGYFIPKGSIVIANTWYES